MASLPVTKSVSQHTGVSKADRNLVLTTYFHSRPDPIRKTHVAANHIDYISPWYDSMRQLGLDGVVFHDGLSAAFVARYQTPRIQFVHVDPADFTHSLNDFRFIVYWNYLRQRPDVEEVFMTDGNDVKVVQSPFGRLKPRKLYAGSEPGDIKRNRFVRRRIWLMNQGLGREVFRIRRWWPYRIYNAGIVGGCYATCMSFLEHMVHTLGRLDAERRGMNLNMAVFNYVVYQHFRRRTVTGAPVHSIFKRYENDRRDVWFIHK